ncbi:M3 family oligoendopeptidase [Candidatus Microgenomates bacterium]|nr:M3 family oligoendopeptidase [Candidatus Microgenomates bacterium]
MAIVKKTTWDLSSLLQGDNDPRIEEKKKVIQDVVDKFVHRWSDRKDYLVDPIVLKSALDEYEAIIHDYYNGGDVGYYFWLRSALDQNDPTIKARNNQTEEFVKKIGNEMQFFTLRIAKIKKSNQAKFLAHPDLAPYRYFLERLFVKAKYQLSEPEEKIMTLKSSASYEKWVEMTENFLAKEEREVLLEDGKVAKKTLDGMAGIIKSRDKKVRDGAAVVWNDILAKFVEVAEVEMNAILADKKTDDQLRGFARPDEARHVSGNIDSATIDTLIDTVSADFPVVHRFYRLKADLLGLPRLAYHERNLDYGNLDKNYLFDEAVDLVDRAFQKLDPKFTEIFRSFLANGQIDVYPNKGKSGGAFCVRFAKSKPTFVLLNYNEKLRDIMTIAHEMGHAINNEMVKDKQNALNFGTSLSVAEVASTFMEDFVLQEITTSVDEETKLTILMARLDDAVSAIYRQTACYLFEKELHARFREKGYLSKEEIGQIFQKHMASYMGEAVEQSKGSENWWVYWSHIRNFFYVYSYASGLLISKALQNKVKKDPAFIVKVKDFLSAGKSESPKDTFAKMGIDITDKKFWEQGLAEIKETLDEAEKLALSLSRRQAS